MRTAALILLLSLLSVLGATKYVWQGAVGGANNGSSWTDAWTNLANINWNNVAAGDTVEIGQGNYWNMPSMNKDGTEAAPRTLRVTYDPVYQGPVHITNTSGAWFISGSHFRISGALDTNFVVPASVWDLDVITNNIGIHWHGKYSAIGPTGLNHTNITIEWIWIHNCGQNTLGFPGDGEPQENQINLGDEGHDFEIAYIFFDGGWYGDFINSVDEWDGSLKIHDCLMKDICDDPVQINSGFEMYRCKIWGYVWGYDSGHPDVLQTWGRGDFKFHHNIIYNFGPEKDADGVTHRNWNPRGGTNNGYGAISFCYSNAVATSNNFITSYTPGTVMTNYGGWKGYRFTTTTNILITGLGRVKHAGDILKHYIRLWESADDDEDGSVRMQVLWDPADGNDGQMHYKLAATPYLLQSNVTYVLSSGEAGGTDTHHEGTDTHYDWNTVYSHTDVAGINYGVVHYPEYASGLLAKMSYETNGSTYIYNNIFIDQETNRYIGPGIGWSYDASRCTNNGRRWYSTNHVNTNIMVVNNLFYRPGSTLMTHSFTWAYPGTGASARGTNEHFLLTNCLFANNLVLPMWWESDAALNGTLGTFPYITTSDPYNGEDWGPMTVDFKYSNNVITGPNFQISGGSNWNTKYSSILALEAVSSYFQNNSTNMPSLRRFDKYASWPYDIHRVTIDDTVVRSNGLNLTSLTNWMPDLDRDIDWNLRPTTGPWDIGPYQFGNENLIVWFDFDDTNWVGDGIIRDISGYNHHGLEYGFGNGTNWPLLVTSTNGTWAAEFNRWTSTNLSEGQEGRYAAITNTWDLTNLSGLTFAVWGGLLAVTNTATNWSIEGDQAFIDAGYGYQGGFTFSKDHNLAWRTRFWTNSQDTDVPKLQVLQWPQLHGAGQGGSTSGWHHFAWTYDGSNVIGYQDATAFQTTSVGLLETSTTNAHLRRWVGVGVKTHYTAATHQETPEFDEVDDYPNHGWLHAYVDDLRLYNRALTPAEITSIYLGQGIVAQGGGGGEPPPPPPAGSSNAPAWPLKISSNSRYFVDQNTNPVFLLSENNWMVPGNLNSNDFLFYVQDLVQTSRFNAQTWMLTVDEGYSNQGKWTNAHGHGAFDPALDYDSPNPTYWDYVAWLFETMATNGITVYATATYLGNGDEYGLRDEFGTPQLTVCSNYGYWIGNRFKNNSNVVWFVGGDMNPTATIEANMDAWVDGFQQGYPSNVIFTAYAFQDNARSRYSGSWLNVDTTYEYTTNLWQNLLTSYNYTPAMPVVLFEADFENDNKPSSGITGSPAFMRCQTWWAMTRGHCGANYGNIDMVYLDPGWEASLDDEGRNDMRHAIDFFATIDWWTLIPDQQTNVITAGLGTGTNRVTVATNAARDMLVAYLPEGAATITLDRSKFSVSSIQWQWFNPRAGGLTNMGGFSNSGSTNLTKPDGNDWVLLLTESAGNPAILSITPSTIAVSCLTNTDAGATNYRIWNSGDTSQTISYTNTVSTNWFIMSLTNGTVSSETDTNQITFSTSGLSAGSHTGYITNKGWTNGVLGWTELLTINLSVTNAPAPPAGTNVTKKAAVGGRRVTGGGRKVIIR